ncbi:DUF6585 family protein [Parachitinimonas caeni]|uniref:Uncharacterized protein n=1 Tax=Parachitinimonas caeni TaxID=3031301 RepID=A0ABT7E3W7_9NEIS|nr:DUF6585 family protein [Parachitinimonas caeni]MDK2125592.1 hypothetical protein [Parachitinimonas caeni]
MKIYRMTWATRIFYSLLLLPVVGVGLSLMLIFFEHKDYALGFTAATAGMAAFFGWLAVLIYFGSAKVMLRPDRIIQSSYFGTCKIKLDARTNIYYEIKDPARAKLILSPNIGQMAAQLAGNLVAFAVKKTLGQAAANHLDIVIESGSKKIKLDSNVKGIYEIRQALIEFEEKTKLPQTLNALKVGRVVEFGNIELTADTVFLKNKSLDIAVLEKLEIVGDKLKFVQKGKLMSIFSVDMTTIPNLRTLVMAISHQLAKHS